MAPVKIAPNYDEESVESTRSQPPDETLKSHDQLFTEALDKIEKSEFSRLTRENVQALFSFFDLDTSGYISIEEIKSRFEDRIESQVVKDSLHLICSQADSSGDGFIDIEEFYQALCLNLDANPYKRVLRGAERKANVWVKRGDIVKFLRDRQETMESCQWLPFYVVFFALAFSLVIMHLQVEEVHNSLESVRSSFSGVGDTVDGWRSLEDNFIDWAAESFLEATHLDAEVDPGRIQKDNQIVGGVKMKMEKAERTVCSSPTLGAYFDVKAAVSAAAANEELKLCYGAEGASDTKWLLLTHGLEELVDLRDNRWINELSTTIVVTFFTYNAHSGFYVVVKLAFERDKFGKVEFSSTYESFSSDPYNTVYPKSTIIACDLLFSAMVLFMVVSEISELIPVIVRNGLRKGFGMYWSVWNAIDWFNILCSLVICSVYFFTVANVMKMNTLVQEIPIENLDRCISYPSTCVSSINGGNSVLDVLDESTVQANYVGFLYYSLRGITVFFAFSTMLAFFKAFRANPRLRVVTDTLVEAKEDFIHFLVVFASVFFVFVLSGYILFGNEVELFQSAGTAVDTCGMLILGFVLDDVREDMQAAFPVLGVVWIWVFYIILSILLFNMILAIIFDVYGDVKNKTGDADTIFEQGRELVRQKKRNFSAAKNRLTTHSGNIVGKKIQLEKKWTDDEILRYLDEKNYHTGEIVTPKTLIASLGKLFPMRRCMELLNEVDNRTRSGKMLPEISTEDILRLVGRVDQNVRDLRADYHRDKAKDSEQKSEQKSINTPVHMPRIPTEPIEPTSPKSANEESVLAKVNRLESYTAYRMDMIEDKFDSLLAKLDNLIPSRSEYGEDSILEALRELEPKDIDELPR